MKFSEVQPSPSETAFRRLFNVLVPLSIVALLSAPAVAQPARPDEAGAEPGAGEEPAVRHVDVGGGRKMALVVRGRGGPTVVIETGFTHPGVRSGEWEPVAAEVSKSNAVVLYDRAGLGASDPAPAGKPRTSHDAARDLHALLSAAKIPAPYVLVGHSIGGLHVRVFADLYPDEVAGVVLVDATHPDQEAKWLAALPREAAGEAPPLKQARAFLRSRLADRGKNPERLDLVESRKQVRAAKSLGDKPLAVLAHSPEWKMVPDLPDDLMRRIERVTQQFQAETAKLSTAGSHVVAKKAGHAIHVDEPELVIKAIRDVAAKTPKPAEKRE